MRYYKIGVTDTLECEEIVKDLKNRKEITERFGVEFWESYYMKICNVVRKQFGFNNYIMLRLPIDPENKNTIFFGVDIFDLEVDMDNHKVYQVQIEEGTNNIYIDTEAI